MSVSHSVLHTQKKSEQGIISNFPACKHSQRWFLICATKGSPPQKKKGMSKEIVKLDTAMSICSQKATTSEIKTDWMPQQSLYEWKVFPLDMCELQAQA